jgi:hypothetical protein
MRNVARKNERDRQDLFRATAQAMRVHEAVVEKDFWVCWLLDYLFQDSPWKDEMAFKGGTSLSKAFGAIERFSEDVDLILDWRRLGYGAEEPWAERSVTKQDAFGKTANRRAATFLAQEMAPVLRNVLSERAGVDINVEADEQEVRVWYPKAFFLAAILPQIRLEIGPLAAWTPNVACPVRPYAAERFPHVFTHLATMVRTITAERTFWEKATILHQEAHRAPARPLPARYSRHYYDLYRLSRLPVGAAAVAMPNLLHEVVCFKMRFYHCPWAHYETAKPGTLRLLPPAHNFDGMHKDYAAMQAMLFGAIPTFTEILNGLTQLERTINGQNA